MKSKRKYLLMALALLLLGLGAAFFLWPRDRITADSWTKIRLGMTEKEVEDILGEPGKELHELLLHGVSFISEGKLLEEGNASRCCKAWLGRRGNLAIHFDLDFTVTGKTFRRVRPATFLDRVRNWLDR